jgi:hypothetical protein
MKVKKLASESIRTGPNEFSIKVWQTEEEIEYPDPGTLVYKVNGLPVDPHDPRYHGAYCPFCGEKCSTDERGYCCPVPCEGWRKNSRA